MVARRNFRALRCSAGARLVRRPPALPASWGCAGRPGWRRSVVRQVQVVDGCREIGKEADQEAVMEHTADLCDMRK
jgi:hypothetical protein